MEPANPFWTQSAEEIRARLKTSPDGLSDEDAAHRLASAAGTKALSPFAADIKLFLYQFKSPLVLLLVFGLALSASLGEFTNSAIILFILLLSGTLGFRQERNARTAASQLQKLVQVRAHVRRSGTVKNVVIDEVVSGDVIVLNAGDCIPADALIVESKDLYVNESALTGESYPAEKRSGLLPADTPIIKRNNTLFKGTSIVSGSAVAIAIETGAATEIGNIEAKAGAVVSYSAFEKGIREFGNLLMRIALLLAGIVLIVNIATGKPPFSSILFGLALSMGLTPELLPAILSITLSAGAWRLAAKKVIVKRLSSIQNLGSMDVLCSDKTGTLTEGIVRVDAYLSPDGLPESQVQQYAFLNATFESGYVNPIDEAIRTQSQCDISGYSKFDEVPFDFVRKRLSIVTAHNGTHIMITKGALKHVTERCTSVRMANGATVDYKSFESTINDTYERLSNNGYRVIGIACKDVTDDPVITQDDETGMTFVGFVTLYDPLRHDIESTTMALREKGVALKIVTGDNLLVAASVGEKLGIARQRIISGAELHALSFNALALKLDDIDIFAETEPAQKEDIVKALQMRGHVVGYLGDGINDAPALKAADVGISVNNAVDAAKDAASLILLEKELSVVTEGILEGRKTYLNTLKYIFITISANFGNVISMAGASIILPFLPLLPSQILLTNFLTDLPALAIASDNVDGELLLKPRKWDIAAIRTFMVVFGAESSLFDFLTFGILSYWLHATEDVFRTGWFMESVITEILILLVIRTRRTFMKSKPGRLLLWSGVGVILLAAAMPYIPASSALGLAPLPPVIFISMLLIAAGYVAFGEITKKAIFRHIKY